MHLLEAPEQMTVLIRGATTRRKYQDLGKGEHENKVAEVMMWSIDHFI